jgi:acetyl-CoA C-acetyltransferase
MAEGGQLAVPFREPYVAKARMAPDWTGDPGMAEAAEHLARLYGIPRRKQDEWACRSVERTLAAASDGGLAWGLTPVLEGASLADQWRDRPLNVERLGRYPTLVAGGDAVTAANSAPPADGAAAILLGSERAAGRVGVAPLARVAAYAAAGVSPSEPGMGAVPALDEACRQAGRRACDLDRVEINDAFAIKVLACIKKLGLDPERVNPEGGSIALGHPFGATGTILLVRLLSGMAPGRYGAVALGIAGGLGAAMVVERL